ncbi:aliphatic sulfonate ABC transporter substrate-binding protein [Numidum massiliense]|uniref:aliphatic sulfonate ABC transporter substrate-binding protein n=1 Tax=Numidum massiliense TaxID=1522315 RepID=UPI0006D53B84|nr:aliphatic sulfonate ABC transporter substrate-binding protein [Numidum massiliense]
MVYRKRRLSRLPFLALSVLLLIATVTGCAGTTADALKTDSGEKKEVTIGYFPNLTHIATIVALEKGYYEEAFGDQVAIQTKTVNNGGLFMEAMATKAIDIGTVGPGPVINFYVKNPDYHIISGAVNGGAVLVVRGDSGINDLSQLDGKRIAIPVIGSTQDVMLRKALQSDGLQTTSNGGTVELFAAAPSDTAPLFLQKSVDGAATQEPWGGVLEEQADGKLLLDWDAFAWGEESTNTVVVARNDILADKSLVRSYLEAHVKAVKYIQKHPAESRQLVIAHIKQLTGKELDEKQLAAAFQRMRVTSDVNESVIKEMASISKEAGYISEDAIDGLVDLSILNELK